MKLIPILIAVIFASLSPLALAVEGLMALKAHTALLKP